MPTARIAELAGVTALAVALTLTIAVPVLRAPSTRVFGQAIVGRHHDPFTVMELIARPLSSSIYRQPVTDLEGRALARLAGPVAGYNWLILLSFPLSAVAAFLLARHLALSTTAATIAALAYAFSPFHLAHAAYHAHIAQTQWLPLYLLALWRCVDAPTVRAVALLVVATLAVTLADFYGALIAAVITPIALVSYSYVMRAAAPHARRRLAITSGTLAMIAALTAVTVWIATRHMAMPAAARDDLFKYSAKWWSYLMPAVAHPWLGAATGRLWAAAGVGDGLLEQQLYLGAAIVLLGGIAILLWLFAAPRLGAARAVVPVLAIVAVTALLCSLSPERQIGALTFTRPSALLYAIAPMFRSYARFGVVVQLMAALLAGVGLDALRRACGRHRAWATAAIVALMVGDYAVAPSALSRDVLPTTAHRWITGAPAPMRALDCAPLTPESESVRWLSHARITPADVADDCRAPNVADALAAGGFTHLLIRHGTVDAKGFTMRAALPEGLQLARHFPDADVYLVTTSGAAVVTMAMNGFSPREQNAAWSWRWMGADASWSVVNTTNRATSATLAIELSAFHQPRRLDVRIDGRSAASLLVQEDRHVYTIGPLTLTPGPHLIVFHPEAPPTIAGDVIGSDDRRALSFAIGTWRWRLERQMP